MIFIEPRDTRFITIRRGGTLTDEKHRLLALWAADCAEHVLHLFEKEYPNDLRPRFAIEQCRAWVRGDIKMMQSRDSAGHANAAVRDIQGAARFAAYSAAQAAAVPHVAAHELGAAAYAIKAVQSENKGDNALRAGIIECEWQRDHLRKEIRELVLDDQKIRNHVCWNVFSPI